MNEIHLTGIKHIEVSNIEGVEFKYKPEVPKLVVYGKVLIADAEEEPDDTDGFVFVTQKQLNQILLNKEVELKFNEDNKWYPAKPLTKEQVKKIGLVKLESEYMGSIGDLKGFEVIKVSE